MIMNNRFVILISCLGFLLGVPWTSAAQWIQTTGPGGCHITLLVVSGETVYAGTQRHGIFASDDNGVNWREVNSGLPHHPEVRFLTAQGIALFLAVEGGGGYLSKDGGANWVMIIPGTPQRGKISCIAVSGSILFAGYSGQRSSKERKIIKSMDGGASWIPAETGLPEDINVSCMVVQDSNLFVGTSMGVFISPDDGKSWAAANGGLPEETHILSLTECGGSLIATTALNGFFISTDSGANWSSANLGLPQKTRFKILSVFNDKIFAAPDLYWIAPEKQRVFYSANNGRSWFPIFDELKGENVTAFVANEKNLFVGTDKGLFLSADNGESWRRAYKGFPSEDRVYSLAAIGENIFAASIISYKYYNFLSSDLGDSWKAVETGLPDEINPFHVFLAGSHGLFAWCEDGVFRSLDNGESWTFLVSCGPSISCLEECDGKLFTADGHYSWILISLNNGKTWAGQYFPDSAVITCFYISGRCLFAGTGTWGKLSSRTDTTAFLPNNVYYSLDWGLSWKSIGARFSRPVRCLATFGNSLLIGTDRGIYCCDDYRYGTSAIKLKLPREISVNCIEVVGKHIVLGTDKGAVILRRERNTWKAIDTGLPEGISINCFAVSGLYLFAGTTGFGVWRLPFAELQNK